MNYLGFTYAPTACTDLSAGVLLSTAVPLTGPNPVRACMDAACDMQDIL